MIKRVRNSEKIKCMYLSMSPSPCTPLQTPICSYEEPFPYNLRCSTLALVALSRVWQENRNGLSAEVVMFSTP